MRSDFESLIEQLPDFQPLFESAQVRVLPLEADELRQAIALPARQVGLKFESGLVEQLVADVLGEPAALPLLQFILLKLWDRRDRNRVTWDIYNQLGSTREALKVTAEELYKQLSHEDRETARRIMLKMARPTAGLEIASDRIRRSELYQDEERGDRIDSVLQKLLDARLVRLIPGDTSNNDQIEIAHEALIRNWPRLIAWLEDERARLRQRLRLADRAKEWQQHDRPRSMLLTQRELLAETQQYSDLSRQEIDFVRHSKNKVRRRKTLRIASLATVILMQSIVSIVAILQADRAEDALDEKQAALEEQRKATKEAEFALAAYEQALSREKESDAVIEQQQTELSQLSSGASKLTQDGYQALLQGDVQQARNSFLAAEQASPGYGSAAQLYSELLTEDSVSLYNNLSEPTEKGNLLRSDLLIYYFKAEDNGQVEKILDNQLRPLGFDPEIKQGTLPMATNAIWFGDQISLETVKTIATILVENGISIQVIAPFRSSKPQVVQFRVQLVGCTRNWTVEDIRKAAAFPGINEGCAEF